MTVDVTIDDGTALVVLDRADRLNSLTHGLVADLHATLADVGRDRDVRCVILTGAGRAFCAGLDLDGYHDDALVERDGPTIRTYERQQEIAGLVTRIRQLRQPVVAAVNGPATGGGLGLVLASDVRIASTEARFAMSFIRAGFSACDIGTSWILPRLVGVGRAHELMLTGRTFSGQEALDYGLVTDLVTPDLLLARAREVAGQIARNPPFAVDLTKAGMWLGVETSTQQASIELENRQQVVSALTADAHEATAAFLLKRPPRFVRR